MMQEFLEEAIVLARDLIKSGCVSPAEVIDLITAVAYLKEVMDA